MPEIEAIGSEPAQERADLALERIRKEQLEKGWRQIMESINQSGSRPEKQNWLASAIDQLLKAYALSDDPWMIEKNRSALQNMKDKVYEQLKREDLDQDSLKQLHALYDELNSRPSRAEINAKHQKEFQERRSKDADEFARRRREANKHGHGFSN